MGALLAILRRTSQQWINAKCGQTLSQILLSPQGLLPSLVPIVGFDIDSASPNSDSKSSTNIENTDEVIITEQLNRAAQLVTTIPRQAKSPTDYYKLILPQVFDLVMKTAPTEVYINPKASTKGGHLKLRLAETGALILSLVFLKEPQVAMEQILTPLLRPLQLLSQPRKPFQTPPIQSNPIVSSKEMLLSLNLIHGLMTVQAPSLLLSETVVLGEDGGRFDNLLALWRTMQFATTSRYSF